MLAALRLPPFERRSALKDTTAGLVLGVESVPDGLASGVLAGVNPLAGLYGYLYGTLGGALLTSTPLMAVQATGAMALIVADADIGDRADPGQALFTLTVLTGALMVAAAVLRAGTLLRFVPTAVMVGFISAVGVSIVLGQLSNFTGYDAQGANRVSRTADLLLHPWRIDAASAAIGLATVGVIVGLQRTRVRAFGLVAAVVGGSLLAAAVAELAGAQVVLVRDLSAIPDTLPAPSVPGIADVGALALPAVSLAFVGLVQGAAVSAGFPRADGRPADTGRDFAGQGAGSLLSGVFGGLPVGGSMSASALVTAAGAQSRLALFVAAAVMALVVLVFGGAVGAVAMPALAGLLIVVGLGAVDPARIRSVAAGGRIQTAVLAVTFTLTLLIPLQFAVLAGVGLAVVLHVVRQGNAVAVSRLEFVDDRVREVPAPTVVPATQVLVLQVTGSLFFASAPLFERGLPEVGPASRGAVVVLRLRGVDQLGLSVMDVLRRYAARLRAADSKLLLVVSANRVVRQLEAERIIEDIGAENLYVGNEWVGETVRRAHDDGGAWIRRTAS